MLGSKLQKIFQRALVKRKGINKNSSANSKNLQTRDIDNDNFYLTVCKLLVLTRKYLKIRYSKIQMWRMQWIFSDCARLQFQILGKGEFTSQSVFVELNWIH